jgi:hypothetical protein
MSKKCSPAPSCDLDDFYATFLSVAGVDHNGREVCQLAGVQATRSSARPTTAAQEGTVLWPSHCKPGDIVDRALRRTCKGPEAALGPSGLYTARGTMPMIDGDPGVLPPAGYPLSV